MRGGVAQRGRGAVARVAAFHALERERVTVWRCAAAVGVGGALGAAGAAGKAAPSVVRAVVVRAAADANVSPEVAFQARPAAIMVPIDVTAAASLARLTPAVAHVAAFATQCTAARGAAMEGEVAVR